MRRFVFLALLPALLVGRVPSGGHVHAGMTAEDGAAHAARPHVHVHGVVHRHPHDDGHRHGEGHRLGDRHRDDRDEQPGEPVDSDRGHDRDAVYLPDVAWWHASAATASLPLTDRVWAAVPLSVTAAPQGAPPKVWWSSLPPPLRAAECPVFLRNLSIRR